MLMKRILICFFSVLLSLPLFAQEDPVVMTVNGYDVKKTEFEYFFNKNRTETKVTRKTVKQYANLYLNFKLKVQDAMDRGMDKSETFLKEYRMYRDMQAENFLSDTAFIESAIRSTYEESVESVGPDGLADISIISIAPLDSLETEEEGQKRVDSIYEMLQSGEDFASLASKYSVDDYAARGGNMGWTSRFQLPEDLGDIVFEVGPGQYTEPINYYGLFIILKVNDRRDIGSYKDNHDRILQWLDHENNIIIEAKKRVANDYAARLGWAFRDEQAVAHLDSVLEEVEPEFANISREYHDGLLLFDVSNKEVWEKASQNRQGMESYFNSHKKEFRFKEPSFKGMVFFCANEDVFNQVKTALDGVEMKDWIDKVIPFNKETVKVRVMRGSSDVGIFKKGQNAYVDKLVFGTGEYEPMKNFPYVNVIGKTIKEPESIDDVKSQVLDAYQKHLEDEWVNGLKKKYKYKIYNKALRKVSIDK